MEEFDTSGLIQEYLDDARGHLDKLDSSLLDMEKDAAQGDLDVELVSDLLGALHTLKGNSGMMGFTGLQKYVHHLESVFKSVLEGRAAMGDELLQGLFEAAAVLRETLDQIEKDPKTPPPMADRIEDLDTMASAAAETGAHGGAASGPKDDASGPSVRPSATGRSAPARADSFKYIGAKSSLLKVDFERLDHLLNLAGELVIHRTKLAQVDMKFKELYGDREMSTELSEAASLINKATSDLQEAIMKVRMLPIRQVFQRFPRMVRDLSRERGKEVELTFKGEATELDKTVIDEIGEPLLHLIRNAVDHGIETPAERIEKRKSPVGEVKLTAAQEGNHIIITVSDDGAGISTERLKAKAEKVYSHETVEAMGRDNLLELIYEPGFSTAAEVTQVSGRGVGLDVVKKNVARLGGLVEVDSVPDKGTTFTIKLPLTLAIISALMVGSGRELYALPLSSVVESIRIEPSDIHTINSREVVRLRDRVLPLVRLSSLFGVPPSGNGREGRSYVVVVGRAEKKVGLVVDRLMGRQEIVIKALDEYVGECEGIAGATILGDGSVVLILDVAGLVERNLLKADRKDQAARGGTA
ncbi:MAG: chemotaxis protein CheA [Nitrospirae bacterium]|nr:chemotaxis protein CheA [Nitrospirota bacterium]